MRVVAMLAAVLVSLTLLTPPATAVSRSEVLTRANSWRFAYPPNNTRVPYSQTDHFQGYRQDCSGYVAMAAKLPAPGPNTVGLISNTYTFAIESRNMLAGDLMIDAIGDGNSRHVVIFDRWTDSSKTAYYAYEQRGDYGTDHRVRTYGLEPGSEYKPRRLHVVN